MATECTSCHTGKCLLFTCATSDLHCRNYIEDISQTKDNCARSMDQLAQQQDDSSTQCI